MTLAVDISGFPNETLFAGSVDDMGRPLSIMLAQCLAPYL
jgi:hypothetical protein